MSKLVSIVIPCYRQGHLLAAAIDSALGQTYERTEVVVVNDGSDDDTDRVAREYGSHIIYVSQRNQGLSAARNSGIGAAAGRYILVLDADDLLHPQAVEWLVDATCAREDVLCVMGFRHFGEAIERPVERLPDADDQLSARLLTTNLGPPHCYLSSRSMIMRAGGFDLSLKSCEDWDMWLKLVFDGAELLPVRHVGAFYYQHPASMSRNVRRMAETRVTVMSRICARATNEPDVIRRLGVDPKVIRRKLKHEMAREHLDAGYLLREQGCYAQAIRQYCLSVYRGRPSLAALYGVGKLLPHRLFRACRSGGG